MKMKRKTYLAPVIILSLLIIGIVLNVNSFDHAKSACINNGMIPDIQKDFLAFNWSVSCQ